MTSVHILLIEDDKRSEQSLERLPCAQGYSVTVCRDGTQGFQRAREGDFDLVITDFQLPGEDGLDSRQTMREKPQLFGFEEPTDRESGEKGSVRPLLLLKKRAARRRPVFSRVTAQLTLDDAGAWAGPAVRDRYGRVASFRCPRVQRCGSARRTAPEC